MSLKPICIWHRYEQNRNRLGLKHLPHTLNQSPTIWYWCILQRSRGIPVLFSHVVETDKQTDTITLDLHGSIIRETLIYIRPVVCTSALTRHTRATREVKKKCATAASGRTVTAGDAGVTRKPIHEFVSLRSFKNVLPHTEMYVRMCVCVWLSFVERMDRLASYSLCFCKVLNSVTKKHLICRPWLGKSNL